MSTQTKRTSLPSITDASAIVYWVPMHKAQFISYKRTIATDSKVDELNTTSGFLLPYPKTKLLDNETIFTSAGLEIAHSSMQGYRRQMEDAHIIEDFDSIPLHTLVAVLDGHAGSGVSVHASCRLLQVIEETSNWRDYVVLMSKGQSGGGNAKNFTADCLSLISKALVQAFVAMDNELRESDFLDASGSTAVCAVITPSHVICANIGDSRCVIGLKDGTCVEMTEDHKPELEFEKKRIIDAGGFVMYDRVNGELAMSRALGDFQYKDVKVPQDKQMVTCYPDISVHERSSADQVMCLACDGVWDVMSNSEAVLYLTEIIPRSNSSGDKNDDNDDGDGRGVKTDEKAIDLAESLIKLALQAGSTDNLSAVIVKLDDSGSKHKKKRV